MGPDYIIVPNPANTKFSFPEKVSVANVHKSHVLCDITIRLANALIHSDDIIESLSSPFTKLPEQIQSTIKNWGYNNYKHAASSIQTLETIAMLAAFFFPNLRNHLMTSRTLSIISITSSALVISKKVSFLIKSKVDLSREIALCSSRLSKNQENFKTETIRALTKTVITATFFALAFKTPMRTAFDRMAYCTQSALTNWKITNWETLAESIQGISTLTTAVNIIKLHYGNKKVTRSTRHVINFSGPLLICAKAASFYLSSRGLAKT